MLIRSATPNDAEKICGIFNHYILNTPITFETVAALSSDMKVKIEENPQTLPWLVLEIDGKVVGCAKVSKWRPRPAYDQSVETSVYLSPECTGKGLGKKLYEELLKQLKELKYHAIMAGIALPNDASVALHEFFNFKKVGHFHEVGYKFGRRIDVGYWQLILNDD